MLVTSFGGQIMGKNGEFLVFMDAEDSSEGLVKAAMRKKVYKCLEVQMYAKLAGQGKTCYSPECIGLNFIFSTKDFAYF